jgi:hypothetical protein
MCLAAAGAVVVAAAKLLLERWMSRYRERNLKPNSLIALGNMHVANKKAGIAVGLLLNLYISYSY